MESVTKVVSSHSALPSLPSHVLNFIQMRESRRFLGNQETIPLFRWSNPRNGTSRVHDLRYPDSTDPMQSDRMHPYPRLFTAIGALTDASLLDIDTCISRPVSCPTAILKPLTSSPYIKAAFTDIAKMCTHLYEQAHFPVSLTACDLLQS